MDENMVPAPEQSGEQGEPEDVRDAADVSGDAGALTAGSEGVHPARSASARMTAVIFSFMVFASK